jgi:flagellar motor switch protein FliN/FliY
MPGIPEEIITRIGNLQNPIWSTVSLTASENTGQALNFTSPLTVEAKVGDLYTELAQPMMVVQFAFADLPEHMLLVLFPRESVAELLGAIVGEVPPEIDDNAIAELRSFLESVVQGICLAIGNSRSDTVVASGLSIRFQVVSLPPNLQRNDSVVRTQVALAGDGFSGSTMILMDSETAHHVLGVPQVEEEVGLPFQPIGSSGGDSQRMFHPLEDHSGLELLMDIPLEISVELGRVKMLVREVVELGSGSIVELDKAAGEPVDVLVNGRLVARGEVVVIEDNFGVRVTEILSPQERVGRLGEAA